MTGAALDQVPAALLRKGRGLLDADAQERLRRATRRAGAASAGLRMRPGFIVVGAQRCGTTTLYRLLSDHPSIVKPLFHKGIGYFDLGYANGPDWYRGHFPLARLAALRTRSVGAATTFDSSGYYLYHPLAAERMAAELPDVKVVVLVRDPVERAYSAHRHELMRGFETEPFEVALELEPGRIAGEAERMRLDPGYQSSEHRHHSYLARGHYAPQIRAYQEALTPGQVYVIDANRFFAEPREEFGRLLDWLGLPVRLPDHVSAENARPRDPMDASLRERLMAHFESSDSQLAEILGHVPSWRR